MENYSLKFYFDFETGGEQVTEFVSRVLQRNGNLGKYLSQCLYPDCQMFWFTGGEWEMKKQLDPHKFKILKKAILILNRTHATVDQLEKVGLVDISHTGCRLCLREKKWEGFRRSQLRQNHFPCYATAGEFCSEEYREVPCSHPCTIHPEREAIRKRRMEALFEHHHAQENNQTAVAM